VKTDANGHVEWYQISGGAESDDDPSIIQTADGKYVLAAITYSYGAGNTDMWLIKMSESENTRNLVIPSWSQILVLVSIIVLLIIRKPKISSRK
jgi:hypothetical protein